MKYLLLLLLFSVVHANAEITIIVNKYPKGTTEIFVAGSFNQWNPSMKEYQMIKSKGIYYLKINQKSAFEFKFTQGSWAHCEVNADGSQKANRVFQPTNLNDTIWVSIEKWAKEKSQTPPISTMQKNVLEWKDFYMPQLQRNRTIRILLPLDYSKSKKRYPVLYLQDGQNVFNQTTAANGTEWGVDETMNAMQKHGSFGCIVVAIDHGGALRSKEYIPFNTKRFGESQGKAYAEFVAMTLKTAIDSAFRTLSSPLFNGIGGSSLGANIAQYIAFKYPEKFRKVLLLSPAYWVSDSSYLMIPESNPPRLMRLVMRSAAIEGGDSETCINMFRMRDTLFRHGFYSGDISDSIVKDGAHSEWFWKREFQSAFTSLYGQWIPLGKLKRDLSIVPNYRVNKTLDLSYSNVIIEPLHLSGFLYQKGKQNNLWISGYYRGDIQILILSSDTVYYKTIKYTSLPSE